MTLLLMLMSDCLLVQPTTTIDPDLYIFDNTVTEHVHANYTVSSTSPIVSSARTTNSAGDGQWSNLLCLDGSPMRWKQNILLSSNKLRNRALRIRNGNRINRSILKLSHWNMGSSLWHNKRTEIEALILEKHPDLLYISEANLMDHVSDQERYIEGYKMYLPLTMDKHKCARIVLLARQEIYIKIHPEWMNEDVAVIWGEHFKWQMEHH